MGQNLVASGPLGTTHGVLDIATDASFGGELLADHAILCQRSADSGGCPANGSRL